MKAKTLIVIALFVLGLKIAYLSGKNSADKWWQHKMSLNQQSDTLLAPVASHFHNYPNSIEYVWIPQDVPATHCASYIDKYGSESLCKELQGNEIPASIAENQCIKLSANFHPKNCFIIYTKVQ